MDVGGAGVLDETAGCHPEQATGGVRQAVILSEATGGSAVEGSRAASAETACGPMAAEGRLAYRFAKRAFDVAFSLAVVLLCLVPVALLCAAIRLESEGSPLYRQRRVGLEGRPIGILKLRTMVADSDDVERHLDPVQLEQWRRERKVDGDPRVTKVGRFLRKTSMAPVIIGTPGDGEPTKSLSHPENSSLDLQKCERRPGTSLGARHHYTNFQFLSFAVFGGPEGASGRPLCACVQAPFAAVGTVA